MPLDAGQLTTSYQSAERIPNVYFVVGVIFKGISNVKCCLGTYFDKIISENNIPQKKTKHAVKAVEEKVNVLVSILSFFFVISPVKLAIS